MKNPKPFYIFAGAALLLAVVGFFLYRHLNKKPQPTAPATLPPAPPQPLNPALQYAPIPADEVHQIIKNDGGKLDYTNAIKGKPLVLDRHGNVMGIAEAVLA